MTSFAIDTGGAVGNGVDPSAALRCLSLDHAKPSVRRATGGLRKAARVASPSEIELAEAVLAQLEDCLATLDELSWTLPAAHLSQAVDSVRHELGGSRRQAPDRADMLPR